MPGCLTTDTAPCQYLGTKYVMWCLDLDRWPPTPMNALVNTEFGPVHSDHAALQHSDARPSKDPIIPLSTALFVRLAPIPSAADGAEDHGIQPSCHDWTATIHDPVAVAASDASCKCRRSSLAPAVLPPASTPMRQAVWGRAKST
ncbi:hypothetical protein TOPH_00233 [Tolypocladium ophioglossoides CBS 100239]|uniref:Uncharacterized protein n=1 Tax=Tolypocladium ophioglossoides (strain CBS 100239) TaxID=1163406 RepID=A0A0L0NML2_TOLOC|nr:hypothetical protein TOPH_00233 [Tolypocladium ophioglossoides CBS 100239]